MLFEDMARVVPQRFDGVEGDALFFNLAELKNEFAYCGIWYARDRSEESVMTSKIYYADREERPLSPNEEIKENSFQQALRIKIPYDASFAWFATQFSETVYGRLKLFDFKKEYLYLNYRIIKNRAQGIDVLGSGVIRGGDAWFARLGVEDTLSKIDFNDTILYLVLIKDIPPPDWGVDHSCYGVGGLPVMVSAVRFSIDRKYSTWRGQNPLDAMNR